MIDRRQQRRAAGRAGDDTNTGRVAVGFLALHGILRSDPIVFVAVVDMTRGSRSRRRRGWATFATVYGYQRFNRTVTWVAVLTVIVLVQGAQFLGNWLARKGTTTLLGLSRPPLPVGVFGKC